MKSDVQRKAAEKPLGSSPKASNKSTLNNFTVRGKGEKKQEPSVPSGNSICRI